MSTVAWRADQLPSTSPAGLARIRGLRAIGITVYYPRYVPSRFHLASVENREDEQGSKGTRRGALGEIHREYALTYCDHDVRCFSVQSIWIVDETGCLGKLTRILSGRSRYFGKLEVCANDNPRTYDWLDGDAALNAALRAHIDPPDRSRFYSFRGTGLTDREAVAIVASLAPLQ